MQKQTGVFMTNLFAFAFCVFGKGTIHSTLYTVTKKVECTVTATIY